eukprot:1796591-Rhodomonas_salina.1
MLRFWGQSGARQHGSAALGRAEPEGIAAYAHARRCAVLTKAMLLGLPTQSKGADAAGRQVTC